MDRVKPFLCGGVASCIAELGTFPVDTTKTRLQIQEGFHSMKYKGMFDCGIKIFKEEGFRSLYNGISPAILRQSIYGTIKFGTYYTLKKIVLTNFYPNQDEAVTKDESMLVNVSCAAFAGGISSALANPTDVLKVRMQAQRRTNSSPLYKCFIDVYRTEGIRGLYRGIFPTSQRAMTIAAVELPVYDFCKNYFMPYVGNQPVNHFVSSFIASLLAALASTPIDVIRTRLMNQKRIIRETKSSSPIVLSSSTPVYFSNSFECLKSILKNEGFLALYKGFIPSWLRMGPWNIIFFLTYERLMNI